MNIFLDWHHGGLYDSFRLLFEKRLGHTLYRPIGLEWYEKGFWQYSHNPATVDQYLKPRDEVDFPIALLEHFVCPDAAHGTTHRALTFQQFLRKDIDIVIASVANHEAPFARLIREYKPNAKLVRQVGNVNDLVDRNLCKNIMASSILYFKEELPPDINVVVYRQEFDLDVFSYQPPSSHHMITSLMNCVPDSVDYPLWKEYKTALPEFVWKMHGIICDDGVLPTSQSVAQAIQDTTFVWHLKWGGDGFGHIIHQAFAMGRPPIVKRSYYEDKLAGELMIHGETCIDLDVFQVAEAVYSAIRYWSMPGNYKVMSEQAHRRFKEIVDYDVEERRIREWMDKLK